MLMRDERLAALRTHYDDDSHVLTIRHDGAEAVRGNLETAEGRAAIETWFKAYCAKELKGPPKVLSGGDHSFSDVAKKVVSIINLASVAALEDLVGQPVDPLRFRGNIHVTGWPAWSEFDLLGKTLAIGDARLTVVKRIQRCAAINVDPDTAVRDLNLPHTMMRQLGHMDCGIYAEVVGDGRIAAGRCYCRKRAGADLTSIRGRPGGDDAPLRRCVRAGPAGGRRFAGRAPKAASPSSSATTRTRTSIR